MDPSVTGQSKVSVWKPTQILKVKFGIALHIVMKMSQFALCFLQTLISEILQSERHHEHSFLFSSVHDDPF